MDKNQQQTNDIFNYKWLSKDVYSSEHILKETYDWLCSKYFGNENERMKFIKNFHGKKILDAGCGSGVSASLIFGQFLNEMDYLGVDITDSIEAAKNRFDKLGIKNAHFLKENIQTMNLNEKFDVIYSEGVIHHTSTPKETFANLVRHLNDDGIIMFYVYKKKAPMREFADDYIREQVSGLSNDEAWEKLIPLTKFGKILGDLNISVNIEDDIDVFGIPKGEYNLQRLFYDYFFKAFYKKEYSIDEMNHINFDWYLPLNCYRYTPEEIRSWLKDNELEELRFIVENSGITVVAKKIHK